LLDAALRRLYGPPRFQGARGSRGRLFSGKLMAKNAGKQKPPSLDEFSDRLDAMRVEHEPEVPKPSGAAWGRAMRVSSDLLAGLFVGTLLGILLDRWLETQPWFLFAGIGLGFAAGLRNIARSMNNDSGPSSEV